MPKRNRSAFTSQQWTILGTLGLLSLVALIALSATMFSSASIWLFPSPTPTPQHVFPATWTPAPTATMIVPTLRVPHTPTP